ncbi:MAG: hypothetical protein D6773_07865, partial [Alphaproteobacteria bacterium]
RFLQEARTLVKLDHPNVVRATRFLRENNTAYLVQEFLAGRDMEEWLRSRSRRPSQAELDKILVPILSALELVHENKILHRDIKPANIFIRKEDHSPVLIDFGASRLSIGEHTGTTALIASPGYSPSEAYSGKTSLQGPWSDVYALAATLYRAISGKPPSDATLRMIEDDYVPAAQLVGKSSSYRPEFLAAIDWGLSVRHQDRPQTIAAFKEALLAGAPQVAAQTPAGRTPAAGGDETRIAPPPPSAPAEAAARTGSSNRTLGFAAAVVLAVAAAGGAYTLLQTGGDDGGGVIPPATQQSATPEATPGPPPRQTAEDPAARIKQLAQGGQPDPGVTECDRLAADWPDPNAVARVVDWDDLEPEKAVPACEKAYRDFPGIQRFRHQLAYALDRQGENAKAVEHFRALADAGYRSAMRRLGIAYYDGSGIAKDEKRGVEWLERAANAGDGRAAGILAEHYETGGETIAKDKAKSDSWYRRALEIYRKDAENGLYHAAYKIGEYHEFGYGVPKNFETAREWYLRGARDDNDPNAMERLGLIYQHGRGTDVDYGEALKWYRRAADLKSSLAMNQIGWLYHQGLGVEKDEREAISWYTRAAEAGNATAMANLAWSYDYGSGTSVDHEKAAEWYLKAYLNGESLEDVTPEAGKIVQRILKERGFFNGETNGVWGESTKQALQAYFDDVNR